MAFPNPESTNLYRYGTGSLIPNPEYISTKLCPYFKSYCSHACAMALIEHNGNIQDMEWTCGICAQPGASRVHYTEKGKAAILTAVAKFVAEKTATEDEG